MKQAIVIIHGIGEQHPMNTLRGFINTIVSEVPDKKNHAFGINQLILPNYLISVE